MSCNEEKLSILGLGAKYTKRKPSVLGLERHEPRIRCWQKVLEALGQKWARKCLALCVTNITTVHLPPLSSRLDLSRVARARGS